MSEHTTETIAHSFPELRPMYMSDLPTVVSIIESHDEDDGEAAESDYHDNGFDNQFVIEKDDKVIGVTGYRDVDGTDHTAWLSWTYLKPSYQGQGLGKNMLSQLLDLLRKASGRKIFVKVSDYNDPEDGRIYERALKTYESLGFCSEVVSEDFYDDGENQHILGLQLDAEDNEAEEESEVEDEKPVIRFNGLHEIAETDGAYTFSWIVEDKVTLFGKRNFTVPDLRIGIESVKEKGGRKIFLTFPSNLVLIHKPLQAAGFKYVGQLKDYYERGVHEMHFTHDLNIETQ